MRSNPVPSPPAGLRKQQEWVERTFPVGASMRSERRETVRVGTRDDMEAALAAAKRRGALPALLPELLALPRGTVATVVNAFYHGSPATVPYRGSWGDLDRIYAVVERPPAGAVRGEDSYDPWDLEDAFEAWDAMSPGYDGSARSTSMIIELFVPSEFVVAPSPGAGRSRQAAVWWPTTDTWGAAPAPKSRQQLPRSQRSWLKPNRASKVDRVFDEVFDVVADEFPDFGDAELYEDAAAGADNGAGSERQFAYCKDGDPMIIAFAPKAETLPLNRLRGLMRHEFGHALEYRYGVKELEKRFGSLPKGIEARADAIAEAVWGDRIVYDDDLVQCVGVDGIHPRPKHLPEENTKLKANSGTPGGPTIDNDRGLGAVSDNANVDYSGLRVLMRPSTFLSLATPMQGAPRAGTVEHLAEVLRRGTPGIGAPLLVIDIPRGWSAGDFSEAARVGGHEGRHRSMAVRQVFGDVPFEVHLFPRYYRNRHLTEAWVDALNRGMYSEACRGGRASPECFRRGPLFQQMPDVGAKPKANPAPHGVITVYHGTGKAMEKPAEIKFKADWSGDFGPGLYFATALSDAMTYGSRIYEARVELKNPIVISGTDDDAALVAWFKKALKITDDDLAFYDNPIAGAFTYFQTLVEVGTYRPDALVTALKKKGYDGIYVEKAAAQKHHKLAPAGDYAVVWSADQILSWEHVDEGLMRETYKAKYDIQRNTGATKRIVLSRRPLSAAPVRPVSQKATQKPNGLWYACGDSWRQWLDAEGRRGEDDYEYAYELDLDLSKMVRIRSGSDLARFVAEFKAPWHDSATEVEEDGFIDWVAVAARYAGIEICPYRRSREPLWYSSWDVASGCIWDNSAIRSVTRIEL